MKACSLRPARQLIVMPGLVPGIHVLSCVDKDVDGRDKPGHDAEKEQRTSYSFSCGAGGVPCPCCFVCSLAR